MEVRVTELRSNELHYGFCSCNPQSFIWTYLSDVSEIETRKRKGEKNIGGQRRRDNKVQVKLK
jgi:hypothetical protein